MKNIFIALLFLLLLSAAVLFFFSGDTGKSIGIHPLSDQTFAGESKTHSGETYSFKYEFFVISNMPETKEAIMKVVKEYNSATLTETDLKKQYALMRFFYKETKNTPRNYKEKNNGYFDHDRLEFHGDDMVLTVKWTEFGEIEEFLFEKF